MRDMNIPMILVSSFALGFIAAFIAIRRHRNPYVWFLIGFVFGLLGVFALFMTPFPKRKSEQGPNPAALLPVISGPSDRFWYYLDEERKQQGPMSRDSLTKAWQNGSIGATTFVWHEELPTWKRLEELIQFKERRG